MTSWITAIAATLALSLLRPYAGKCHHYEG